MVIVSIVSKLITNPFVKKAAINYGVALIKELPNLVFERVRSALTVRVSVTNFDPSYYWLQQYLAQNHSSKSKTFSILNTNKLRNQGIQSSDEDTSAKDWMLIPSSGIVRFRRNGAFYTISKYQGAKGTSGSIILEAINIEVINGSREEVEDFLEFARQSTKLETSTSIHMYNSYWCKVGSKAPRNDNTIIMSGGKKELVFEDLQTFLDSRDWYRDRGIPYHRGYLFSGIAGSGKTSMIDAMASKFNKSVALINVGSLRDDDELYDAFLTLPRNAIIALEDIDCLSSAHKREDGKDKNKHGKEQGVTLAGLLNCLDGIVTPDGAIVVMTSNHPDKLDPALIRPGRADIHVEFHHLNKQEQIDFSRLFYETPIKGVDTELSASKLQSIFMSNLDDVEKAQKEIEKLIESK
jgi:chaperone BCS1